MAKFADNILFFPHLDGLTIRACNLPKTAGATLNFKLDFFGAVHTFVFPKDKPCVRAFLKPLLIALKKTEASKQLDHFIIDMDSNSEAIVIRVTLRNGIKKLYKLPVSDVHVGSLPRLIERKSNPNVLVMEARQLLEALETAGSDSRQVKLLIVDVMFGFRFAFGALQKTSFSTRFSTFRTTATNGAKQLFE